MQCWLHWKWHSQSLQLIRKRSSRLITCGTPIAELTAHTKLLLNVMLQECVDSRFVFDRLLPLSHIFIGSKIQISIQRYGWRLKCVGLLKLIMMIWTPIFSELTYLLATWTTELYPSDPTLSQLICLSLWNTI